MASENKVLDAEKALLGSIIKQAPLIFNVLDILKPEFFSDRKHRFIYEAMVELCNNNSDIDVVLIADHLKKKQKYGMVGKSEYLNSLLDVIPNERHIASYAKVIIEASKMQYFRDFAIELKEKASHYKSTPNSLTEFVENKLIGLTDYKRPAIVARLEGVLKEAYEKLGVKQDGEVRGVLSGFDTLDKELLGFHKSDLIILAARPGMGKTTLALNFMSAAVKQEKSVLFFSLEMSREQIADRLVANEAEVDFDILRKGLFGDETVKQIKDSLGDMSKWNFFMADESNVSMADLKAIVKRFTLKNELDMLIVDYIQLMRVSHRPRQEEIASISRNLKILAKELDVPVIAISQLVRPEKGVRDKRPQLHELKDSSALEADADVVMMMHRESYYSGETADKTVELSIKKHRNGRAGQVLNFDFDGQRQRYKAIDRKPKAKPAAKSKPQQTSMQGEPMRDWHY